MTDLSPKPWTGKTFTGFYTPQIFKKDLILNAHENADKNAVNVTDDCALVEKYGTKVKITETEKK
ncbi:MAG: 2-C-methyl-D-erythritol 4-phosphate cytidylyltransferase [Clostridiales bacterium]|nr:MAG: 2-C-methyl-D-erythritol 4-phosphate cytidylyltransferase [Clostridiales bacterium]